MYFYLKFISVLVMKLNNILLITFLFLGQFSFGLVVTGTYSVGDIPTNNGGYDATCNGAATPLSISLPAGGPWIVTSVDVEYDITSPNAGGGWMSEQRSRLYCQNTTLDEGADFNGAGNNGGTQSYDRDNLTIANGQYAGGTNLVFELQTFRTWAGTAGCNQDIAKIDDGTWQITVNYELAAPMTYVSSNTLQASTSNVQNCASSAEVLKIETKQVLELLGEHWILKTSKERYNYMISEFPNIVYRVSLGHIASYLGMTQETLSRIRRNDA